MSRASWPVAVDVVSSSFAIEFPSFVEALVPSMPTTATATTISASPAHRTPSELVAALASALTCLFYPVNSI
jgi:hypothetical protein